MLQARSSFLSITALCSFLLSACHSNEFKLSNSRSMSSLEGVESRGEIGARSTSTALICHNQDWKSYGDVFLQSKDLALKAASNHEFKHIIQAHVRNCQSQNFIEISTANTKAYFQFTTPFTANGSFTGKDSFTNTTLTIELGNFQIHSLQITNNDRQPVAKTAGIEQAVCTVVPLNGVAACGNTSMINLQSVTDATLPTGSSLFIDLYLENTSFCSQPTRTDLWVNIYDPTFNTTKTARFKSISQGGLETMHIDLSAYKGRQIQLQLHPEFIGNEQACSRLAINASRLQIRKTLIPEAEFYAEKLLKNKFDDQLSRRMGIADGWNIFDWRRVPVDIMTLKDIKAPYYRIFMNPIVSRLEGCGSANLKNCFKDPNELDKVDNLIESLFYNRIPIMANIHGVLLTNSLVEEITDQYKNPRGLMNLFKHNDGRYWAFQQEYPTKGAGYYGIADILSWLGSGASVEQKQNASREWLAKYYQYFRYDIKDREILFGATHAALERYMSALVAIEPGNEQNWHPPEMRSKENKEQKDLINTTLEYFRHFCTLAKAQANPKYCIMTSSADGINNFNNFSDRASFKAGRPNEYTGYQMLKALKSLVDMADFANIHAYLQWMDDPADTFAPYTASNRTEKFLKRIRATAQAYSQLIPNKKFIITEFGYESLDNSPKMINKVISEFATNPLIAGASYWGGTANAWQYDHPDQMIRTFFAAGLRIPFNHSSNEVCPQGGYCPKVKSCPLPYDWKTCSTSAFSYKINPDFFYQALTDKETPSLAVEFLSTIHKDYSSDVSNRSWKISFPIENSPWNALSTSANLFYQFSPFEPSVRRSVADSGWVVLTGPPTFGQNTNESMFFTTQSCASHGGNLRDLGSFLTPRGFSVFDSQNKTNSSEQGWIHLCGSTRKAVLVISWDDQKRQGQGCPTGFTFQGSFRSATGSFNAGLGIQAYSNTALVAKAHDGTTLLGPGWIGVCAKNN